MASFSYNDYQASAVAFARESGEIQVLHVLFHGAIYTHSDPLLGQSRVNHPVPSSAARAISSGGPLSWRTTCDANGHGSAILAQLDDDVYDLARAAGVSSSMPGAEILKKLRGILCGTMPSWLARSEFRHRTREHLEGVLEFHQALRLLGRRAYSTMKAADLEQMLLNQFVYGVSDPEVRKTLLREQPSTLDAALRLAQQEEVLQAACSARPRIS
nr:unnamed protein product [Spirometra erinaceieuropaei]